MIKSQKKQTSSKIQGQEIEDSLFTLSNGEVSKIETSFDRRFVNYGWFLAVLIMLLLGGRVLYLTVVQGQYYKAIAQGNSIRSYTVAAPRGKVFDRTGKVLVQNIPSTDVILDQLHLPQEQGRREYMIQVLASDLDLPLDAVRASFQEVETSQQERVILKRAISQEESLIILEKEDALPGVTLEHTVQRHYEESSIFSHMIGYESKVSSEDLEQHPEYFLTDSIGRQGIEKTFETELRGVHGEKRAEVDSLGRIKRFIATKNPVSGNDLVLTVNAELQKMLHDSVESELLKNDLTKAAAVALDPRNGEVLALVSFPSYDNNIFSYGTDRERYSQLVQDPDQPLFNRVVAGEYPPGSTIKPVIAAAALEEGVVSDQKQIESRGGIQLGSFYFGDWKAHGFTDIRRAIAVSSDVYFYAIGGGYGDVQGLGMERMKYYENLFGYGELTGIRLPGEASGFLPDKKWKEEVYGEPWYIGNSYHAAIGQGFVTATPLQVAQSISVVANGGTLYEPKIVSLVRSPQGEERAQSEVIRRTHIVPDDILEVVRAGMRQTVTEGTALSLNDMSVAVAGKTGTAQFGSEDKTHGWFVSFAPYEDPEIVLVILVEAQAEDGYHAVPITKEVYQWYFGEDAEQAME